MESTRRFFMGLLGLAGVAAPLVPLGALDKPRAPLTAVHAFDDVDPWSVVDAEIEDLRRYIGRARGLLKDRADLDSAPPQWQLYSSYFRDVPEGVTLTRQNVLDLMGYLTLLLAAARADEGEPKMSQIVLTTDISGNAPSFDADWEEGE